MGSLCREVITLQLGHYSNFVGTHWWNLQVRDAAAANANASLLARVSTACVVKLQRPAANVSGAVNVHFMAILTDRGRVV